MAYWELERGPDGLVDVMRDGRVIQVAMDTDGVRRLLERQRANPLDYIDLPDGRTMSVEDFMAMAWR